MYYLSSKNKGSSVCDYVQLLCYIVFNIIMQKPGILKAMALVSIYAWACWFESYLLENPED